MKRHLQEFLWGLFEVGLILGLGLLLGGLLWLLIVAGQQMPH